jgi:uncharacterized protein YndB with AHSA1/START domain
MSTKTHAPADGVIEQGADGKYVLRYERHLDHPVDRVWAAITEPEQLADWLAAADELELAKGGRVTLRWLNDPDREEWEKRGVVLPDDYDSHQPAKGTVTLLYPPRAVEYDTDAMGKLRFELRPDDTGCVLTFISTMELPEGFPAEQTLAGWHIHLEHLAEALAGRPIEWSTWTEDYMDRWAEIRDSYAAKLA